MADSIPTVSQGWELQGLGKRPGWESLTWNPSQPLPALGPTDVLVKFHAASLHYRDLAIIHGTYPRVANDGVVPGADGAGEVIAIGKRVTRFRVGDKVIVFLYQTGFFGGSDPSPESVDAAIGGAVDGTFREHGVFSQEGLVTMPSTLSYGQGAAIMGAHITAWNCLMGGARPLRVGDCVLVQGTGGVSIAALQLAVAAGASVIATTSSKEKEAVLKELGASHVVNYKLDEEWGATAKRLSPGKLGCTHVVDVGGDQKSFTQSLAAVARGGEIEVVGFLATAQETATSGPTFLETLMQLCTVRGIEVGSRHQFEEVNHVIETNSIKPVIDQRIFELRDLKAAYQYLEDQKHFGKVVVKIG